MAFQKTQGRKEYVQPTGMPDLSGIRKSAEAFSTLADAASTIGTSMRAKVYNDAILEAEIAGKTAGAKYEIDPKTGERKLVPLVNFDYAKATDMFSKNEQEGVLRAYRQAAINQYAISAGIDAQSIAQKAYIDNPNNPDAIRGAAEGYFDSLRDLDPEIYATVAPKATASFVEFENRALAGLQLQQKNKAIVTLQKGFTENAKKIANLVATTGLNDKGSGSMFQELEQEQEQILGSLETYGLDADKIEGLRDAQAGVVAIKVGEAAVTRAYAEGGAPAAYEQIDNIIDETFENPNINTDALQQVLYAEVAKMERNYQATVNLRNRRNAAILDNIALALIDNPNAVSEMLADPSHEIHELGGVQKLNVNQQSINLAQQQKNALDAVYTAFYNDNLSVVKNFDFYEPSKVRSAFITIAQQYIDSQISLDKFNDAQAEFNKFFDKEFYQKDRIEAGSILQLELGDNSTFMTPPNELITPEAIKRLEDLGVIGDKKGASFRSRSAYLNKVADYEKRYNKFKKDVGNARVAYNQATAGLTLSSTQSDLLAKFHYTDQARLPDGSYVPLDFFSQDKNVVQASIDTVDVYAVKFNGLLPPEVKSIMEDGIYDERSAQIALRIIGQTTSAMSKVAGVSTEVALNEIFDNNKFTEEQRTFFRLSSKIGYENAIEVVKFDRNDGNRDIAAALGNRTLGKTTEEAYDDFFVEAFQEAMKDTKWTEAFSPYKSVNKLDKAFVAEFAYAAGINPSDVKDAIIADPIIREGLKSLFMSRYLNDFKAGAGSKESAMRSALQSLGKRFGYEKVGEGIFLVERPILYHAQAQVNTDINYAEISKDKNIQALLPDKYDIESEPMVKLTQRMVDGAFVEEYLGFGSIEGVALDPTIAEALKNVNLPDGNLYKSHLRFVANDVAVEGETPSYTVILTDSTNSSTILATNYNFNWKTSSLNASFQKALGELKDDELRNFVRVMNFFDRPILQNSFENMVAVQGDRSLAGVANIYNSLIQNTTGTSFDISDRLLEKSDIDEWFNWYHKTMSLGFQ